MRRNALRTYVRTGVRTPGRTAQVLGSRARARARAHSCLLLLSIGQTTSLPTYRPREESQRKAIDSVGIQHRAPADDDAATNTTRRVLAAEIEESANA